MGLLGACSRGEQLSIWVEYLCGGLHCEDILIASGRLRFGEYLKLIRGVMEYGVQRGLWVGTA